MVRCVHFLERVRLEDGGVARAVLDLCQVIASRGTPTRLVTCDDNDVPAAWRKPGVTGVPDVVVIDPPAGRLRRLPKSGARQLASALQGQDVLHLHGVWEMSNAQAAAVARQLKVPYIVSAHGMLDDWSLSQRGLKKRAYLALIGNRFLGRASRIHLTAAMEYEQVRKRFHAERRMRVIPLIMDLTPYAELPGPELAREKFPGLRAGRPTVLFMSRLHPKKGIEVLVMAADLLMRRGPGREFKYLIAGPGDPNYVESLRTMVEGRGLAKWFDFLGMVHGVEKLSLMQAADVFVLPTSQENFGLALFEALACQARVITTRGVDTWLALKTEGGATIVDATPEAIAAAIAELLDQPRTPNVAGREFVFRDYDPQKVAGDYENLYREVVSDPSPMASAVAATKEVAHPPVHVNARWREG